MRSILLSILGLMACLLPAAEPADYSRLLKVPDLSPQLTSDEVSKAFAPWEKRVKEIVPHLKPEVVALFSEGQTELGSKLPPVTGITLYSLFPIDAQDIPNIEPEGADDLVKLPRFHDFPILGQMRMEDAIQANRWVDFLRDQIIPGDFASCDFRPRHGFRLSTAEGNIDMLMCYSCSQLAYFGPSALDSKNNPVFSSATQAQLNRLFDKLQIKRDEPLKDKH